MNRQEPEKNQQIRERQKHPKKKKRKKMNSSNEKEQTREEQKKRKNKAFWNGETKKLTKKKGAPASLKDEFEKKRKNIEDWTGKIVTYISPRATNLDHPSFDTKLRKNKTIK